MILDISNLTTEQQLEIIELIASGVNPHIAYDHVVYGTPL